MELSPRQKYNIDLNLRMIFYGIVLSLLYVLFVHGISKPVGFINAIFAGFFGGLLIAYIEAVDFNPNSRTYSFLQRLIMKSAIYLSYLAFVIPLIIGIVESFYYDVEFFEHVTSERFQTFLIYNHFRFTVPVAFLCIVGLVFTLQMNRKLGQGVFINHVSGRFRTPREVERVFMFLDLRASTTIAETLSALDFHRFIHEFFSDITEPIVAQNGIIYKYVGDQVIVIWNYERGFEQANCIKTYFKIKYKVKSLEEKYLNKYGIIPRFSTSFHCGKVVIGEVGDIKSQLVYHGEVMHQGKEIEKLFSIGDFEESILISEPVLSHLELPSLYKTHKIGSISEGAEKKIDIYTLEEQKL